MENELERDQPEVDDIIREEKEAEAKKEVKRLREEIKEEQKETAKEEAERIRDEAEIENPSPAINERILKITGSVNIEKTPLNDTEYGIVIRASRNGMREKPNHDGTVDRIYSLKILTLEQIEEV